MTDSYEYNAEGDRVYKKAGDVSTHYLVDNGKILAEVRTEGNSTKTLKYYYGVDGIEFNQSGDGSLIDAMRWVS